MLPPLLSGLALSLFCASASAAVPLMCNTCTTDAEFSGRAAQEEAITGAGGTYWVYNLRDNLVQKWAIPASRGRGEQPRHRDGSATLDAQAEARQAVEAADTRAVDTAHSLFLLGQASLQPIYNVPIELLDLGIAQGKSVYDILLDNNLRAQIESALGDSKNLDRIVDRHVIAGLLGPARTNGDAPGLQDAAYLVFHLVMSDGTSIDQFLDVTRTTARTQVRTARTAAGQPVPGSIDEIEGSWHYSAADDLSKMASHLQRLGAKVEFVGRGSVVRRIACVASTCKAERGKR